MTVSTETRGNGPYGEIPTKKKKTLSEQDFITTSKI